MFANSIMSVFSYHQSKSDIVSPNSDISDKKTIEVYSEPIINGAQFRTGKSVVFDFNTSQNWCDLSESYVNIRMSISDTAGAKLTEGGRIALGFNCGAGLFSRASMQLNGVVVSTSNAVAQTEAFFYRSQTSSEYKNTVGSVSWLDDFDSRLKRTATSITHDVAWTPVCLAPFVSGGQLIPPNSRIRLTFDIASSWELAVASSQEADGTRAAKTNGALNTGAGAVANKYSISVDDLVLNVVSYTGEEAPEGSVFFDWKNYIIQYQNLNTQLNQVLKYSLAPNVYRMALWFQFNQKTNTVDNVYEFKGNNAGGAANRHLNLQKFRFNVGNKQIPALEAQLSMTGNSLQVAKYYKDTMNALLVYDSVNGGETFSEWLTTNGPYLCYSLPRDVSENCAYLDMYLSFGADHSSLQAYLCCETTSIVEVKYSNGKVVETGVVESADINS